MITLQPGAEVAGYRIESLIGRGGMAVVYRAEDMRLGRKVALKLLTPQLADNEQFRQRFIRESRLAASLDHPNIVPIYEAGDAGGQLFIAMRYVLGSDLKALLAEQGGRLPVGWTLRLFGQIADALDSAHRAGLVHRDVKPGNVLITTRERRKHVHRDHVYLTDFGLTKRTSELSGGLTGTGHFLGTVDYVSPEQIQGKPVGPGTDIYALGCVLYECLTGQLPFRRDDDAALLWAHLVEAPPPVSGIRPEVPDAVNAVIARAMAKDAAERYQTCEELLRDLEEALEVPAPEPGHVGATTGDSRQVTVVGPPAGGDAGVGYSLAIDLGTSFVAAAVADDHGLEMVSLGDGALVAPATVYVRGDGRLVTGQAAARRAVSHPDRVAREIKRNLGNPTPIMLGGSPYAVGDLLAALLQDVLGRVAERQGAKPDVVALTHPADWGPFRRQLFEGVAASAGISEPLYITEPEAAAAHYAATRRLDEGDVLAVYDLGGGTFDATVLRRTGRGFEILGTPEGIERLGGADFDEAVFAHVNYLSGGALSELDLGDPQTGVALARLRQDCTAAKEALSVDVEATIPVFLPGRHFDVTLTRDELESMVRAPIESTIGTLDRVLRAARVDPTTLAAVLLVGGSSRIPLVAQMVSEAFGRPTVVGAHPKHAVALGAALRAESRRTKARAGTPVGPGFRWTAETPTVGGGAAAAAALQPGAPSSPPAAAAAPSPGPAAAQPLAAAAVTPTGPAPAGTRSGTGATGPDRAGGAVTAAPSPGVAAPGRVGPVPAPRTSAPSVPPAPPAVAAPGGPPDGRAPAASFLASTPADAGFLGTPPPTPPPGPPPEHHPTAHAAPSPPGRRRTLLLVVGLVLVLLAGGGVAAYLQLRPAAGNSGSASPSAPAPAPAPSESAAPSSPPAAAVPIPSLGPVLAVGPTPNFVVASPSGRQLYVANRDAGTITVVDTAANQVTGTIKVSAGPPQFLAFSPDGRRVYVSVWNDARTIAAVSILDTRTNAITATIPVHTRPFLAAVSPDGRRIFVPNHDTGTVSVIDTATQKLTADFPVPANPHSISFSRDGTRIYVADHESNVVAVVDTATLKVLTAIPVPRSPHNVAVHPTQPLAIVASYDAGSVSAIDTTTNTVVKTIPVENNPQHVAWSADGRFAYVVNDGSNSLSVIDVTTLAVTARLPMGRGPTSMAVLPNGKTGYVSNVNDGTLTEVNLAG